MEKNYNLEDRTYQFAKNCRLYTNSLSKTISNQKTANSLSDPLVLWARITLKLMKN